MGITEELEDDFTAALERANYLAENGHHNEAVVLFRELAATPGNGWVLHNLGNSLWALSDLVGACKAFEQAIRAGEVDSWINLGYAREDLGELSAARAAWRSALEAGDPKAAVPLAWDLLESEGSEEANRFLREESSRGNNFASALLGLWLKESGSVEATEFLELGFGVLLEADLALVALYESIGDRAKANRLLSRVPPEGYDFRIYGSQAIPENPHA